MSLIRCPECGKEISNKAPQCIHCGFPINNKINQKEKKYAIYLRKITGKNNNEVAGNRAIMKIKLRDNYKLSDYEVNKIFLDSGRTTAPIKILDGVKEHNLDYIKKDFERIGCIIDVFESDVDNEILNYRTEERKTEHPISEAPRCPTCGSANIEKISTTSKITGGFLFGIFSSNVRNSFKCNHCGYKW